LLDTLEPQAAASLMSEISAYLRSKSLGGDTAGMVEEGAFSFVHDGSLSTEEIVHDLMEITRRLDPKGRGVAANATSVATDAARLTVQDSAQALLYTLNKFALERGERFDLHSLSDSYGQMLQDTVERIGLFKDTVEFGKFEIAFQPIVDIKNGIIHHYECLVRLQDGGKFANPFHFISFGEQANLIGEFDLAMTGKTLGVLENAAKKGNHPLVAVNLSGRSLSSNLFMDTLKEVLRKRPDLSRQIIVEITESSKINDFSLVSEFIQEMKTEFGSLFCLDDFGTGESSFDYLRNLQVDFIKIDGSYVRESIKTLRGRQMLRAMAGLSNSLGIQTIGDMVEDEKSAGLLYDCGVRFGQGYLYGKPVVDAESLALCGKPTPYFRGTVRARNFRKDDNRREWQ
jgi:EAL domain-containing protein (putative c-di-GMP-specific phosphodiesterase class I)